MAKPSKKRIGMTVSASGVTKYSAEDRNDPNYNMCFIMTNYRFDGRIVPCGVEVPIDQITIDGKVNGTEAKWADSKYFGPYKWANSKYFGPYIKEGKDVTVTFDANQSVTVMFPSYCDIPAEEMKAKDFVRGVYEAKLQKKIYEAEDYAEEYYHAYHGPNEISEHFEDKMSHMMEERDAMAAVENDDELIERINSIRGAMGEITDTESDDEIDY